MANDDILFKIGYLVCLRPYQYGVLYSKWIYFSR